MVAGAQQTAELGKLAVKIPFEAFRTNDGWAANWNDTDTLAKTTWTDRGPNVIQAFLEQEAYALWVDQIESASQG